MAAITESMDLCSTVIYPFDWLEIGWFQEDAESTLSEFAEMECKGFITSDTNLIDSTRACEYWNINKALVSMKLAMSENTFIIYKKGKARVKAI